MAESTITVPLGDATKDQLQVALSEATRYQKRELQQGFSARYWSRRKDEITAELGRRQSQDGGES